ncbi:MAG: hypothetical protein WCO78_04955 [Candidatus Roizmanbacteria bacterium]
MDEQQHVDPATIGIVTGARSEPDATFTDENLKKMEPPGYAASKAALVKLGLDMQSSPKFLALQRFNPFAPSVDGLSCISALDRLTSKGGMLDTRHFNRGIDEDQKTLDEMDRVRLRLGNPATGAARAMGYDIARALPGWVVPGQNGEMIYRNLPQQGLPPVDTLKAADENAGLTKVFETMSQLDRILMKTTGDGGLQVLYAMDPEGKTLVQFPPDKIDMLRKSIGDRISQYIHFVNQALDIVGKYHGRAKPSASDTLQGYYNSKVQSYPPEFLAGIDQSAKQLISDLNTGVFLKVLGLCPFSSPSEAEQLFGQGGL